MDDIRIGIISSVDRESGMLKILYPDKDNSVTQALPYLAFNGEYKMPMPGDNVLVLHVSNGSEMGVVLGTYWNKANPPNSSGSYHKDIGSGASISYDDTTGKLVFNAEHIVFQGDGYTVTLKQIHDLLGGA